MEADSGAKIAIRGKGSVKEGKGRSDAAHSSNQEEDLHCLIMAESEEKINKAKQLIHKVIETACLHRSRRRSAVLTFSMQAASIPEGQNELKRNQLRELATLNGTLRDDENQACQNCGKIGHRKYDCPERQNFTASIICRVCGNAGHMARDCPDRQRGASWRNDFNGGRHGRIGPGGGGDAVDREMEVCLPSAVTHTFRSRADRLSSNSCKNSAETPMLQPGSRLRLVARTVETRGHGSAAPAADKPRGALATTTTMRGASARRGLANAAVVMTTKATTTATAMTTNAIETATTTVVMATAMAPPLAMAQATPGPEAPPALPRGIRLLPGRKGATPAMVDTAVTAALPARAVLTARLPVSIRLVRLLGSADPMLPMGSMEARRRPGLRRRASHRLHHRAISRHRPLPLPLARSLHPKYRPKPRLPAARRLPVAERQSHSHDKRRAAWRPGKLCRGCSTSCRRRGQPGTACSVGLPVLTSGHVESSQVNKTASAG